LSLGGLGPASPLTELGYTHKVRLVLRESADRTVEVRALRRFDELGVPVGAGIGVAAGIVVGAWAVHLGGIPGAGLGALVLGIASVLALRTAPLLVADDAGDRRLASAKAASSSPPRLHLPTASGTLGLG
jgi:hypothetical protein